jgi:thiol-disulfide isomerase/thioredoxin
MKRLGYSTALAMLLISGLLIAARARDAEPCSETAKVCPETAKVCPETVKVCAETAKVCAETAKVCAETKVCTQTAGRKPEVVAVMFHADWCGTCKAMAPMIEQVRQDLAPKPVLFVKLDLTDEQSTQQAEYLAAMLGIDPVLRQHAPKTGMMVLVDAGTREAVGVISKPDSADALQDAIAAALD